MTNNELERLLKTSKAPHRDNLFWENLSENVIRRIQQRPPESDAMRPKLRSNFAPWGIGLATTCLIVGFWFGFHNPSSRDTKKQLAAARKYFREVESLFPNQMRAIVFENGEARLLLSDKPDVPASSPLFVKICSGKNCRSLVTFSGQQIQINGESFEILSDHKGDILLVGNKSIWSSAAPAPKENRFIQAQTLEL